MIGLNQLKPTNYITNDQVGCPVKGCDVLVSRQTKSFIKDKAFKCPIHNIYISPSTFEYEKASENILWKDKGDLALLEEISKVKRENRMARDNSEDAVTWNVFRYLEKKGLLAQFIKEFFGIEEEEPEIIYWSYSQKQRGLWNMLKMAREEFELVPSKGSEPDIIILGKSFLIIVEAKITASNNTVPSKMKVKDKYRNGGEKWWDDVINADFDTIAVQQKKYELARFWLLGSWIGNLMGQQFVLANLVLDERERDINSLFLPYIKLNSNVRFERITWENIFQKVILSSKVSLDRNDMEYYFKNKTVGYKNGAITKAFSL